METNSTQLVIIANDSQQPVTTSIKVAQTFGKRHKDVLRAIQVSMNDGGLSAQNCANLFIKSSYVDSCGRQQPMYLITRDGFSLLAMGFTGKEAMKFKLAYIDAFNAMEAELQNRTPQNPVIATDTMSSMQMVLQQSQMIAKVAQGVIEHETRLANVEGRLNQLDNERKENQQKLLSFDNSDAKEMPEVSLRDRVRERINAYCNANNIDHHSVYHYIYHQLYYRYHVSVNNIRLLSGETKIAALERCGHLGKVFDVCCSMTNGIVPRSIR